MEGGWPDRLSDVRMTEGGGDVRGRRGYVIPSSFNPEGSALADAVPGLLLLLRNCVSAVVAVQDYAGSALCEL